MPVLVYIETQGEEIKKSSLELASYGRAIADAKNTPLIAVSFGLKDGSTLSEYGVNKHYSVTLEEDLNFNAERFSSSLVEIASQEEADLILVSASASGRYLGPIAAAKFKAGYFSNVIGLPLSYDPIQVKRSCFTNKAFSQSVSNKEKNILSLSSNSFGIHTKTAEMNEVVVPITPTRSALEVLSIEKSLDKVTIADADIVVSGGRGLKGPENWHLIEDLATVLGAATACSKPVSDLGWRPHSEHVGQTGKPVASNLYIAIGVSGAIQHLAGINSSKVKVVINSDPDAPFFKAADYGVVGDAFEVVPKLISKLKALKEA
ncbi:electron transfer flavoprotein subunit alpha/FixB family protein [Flavobacteriaceae bacterium]|nr:electron transfer flavoprotein subunit alpha/FixB family protein [Flavobacteriaceae bacterium]